MDHGALTDSNGKKIDFRNVVLIMTTNAGAADAQRNSIGFGRGKQDDEADEAIKRVFTPEFRNRLDAVVAFKSLTPEIIRLVVQKFIMQLEAQLADRHVTIETSDEAADWLARTASTNSMAPGRSTRDPGAHQEAARRRNPVREAGQGRPRPGGAARRRLVEGGTADPAPRSSSPTEDAGGGGIGPRFRTNGGPGLRPGLLASARLIAAPAVLGYGLRPSTRMT
jgi:hypothetical protein